MKHFYIYIIICSFLIHTAGAQEQEFILEFEIPLKADFFKVDHLGNIYGVKGDEIVRYNSKGEQKNRYSNKSLGQVTNLDVSNPMKVVLYYFDLTQIVFLDNTLSVQGKPVSLEELELEQTQLVCYSYNNGVWLYDLNNYELIRLDENLEKTDNTGNINQVIGRDAFPNILAEKANWVYLNDPAIGILVFDIYGTYIKTVPVKGLDQLWIHHNHLNYIKDNKLHGYNLKTLTEGTTPLPEKAYTHIELMEKKLYILVNSTLKVYRFGD